MFICVVGQIMKALLSGKYNLNKVAVAMSQTGGGCRATNYVGFIRRALQNAGMHQIPVVALSAQGIEKNPGFKYTLPMLKAAIEAIVYGDVFMRVLYRMRPYELVPGSANRLHEKWAKRCIASLTGKRKSSFKKNIQGIIRDFDALPIDESLKKPRVGIVGEILVKFSPSANNYLVDLLESRGLKRLCRTCWTSSFTAFTMPTLSAIFSGNRKRRRLSATSVLSFWKRSERLLALSFGPAATSASRR